MAEELSYTTEPAPKPTARDELEGLIETLSESGTLRALQGFTGQFAGVSGAALEHLTGPAGRRLIGSVALLAEVLSNVPAEKLEGVASGFGKGTERASEMLGKEPPGTLQVLKLARDPDVRRAMASILIILKSIGEGLGEGDRSRGQQDGIATSL
ncbi:DUF1641 domain-containing protein [Pelagicoccus sp. SDUM812002]|uniref:DUF1641 domain-containing protein n=1 Tax=Pelagicoccus sp. SDUM812002 TaxID=3041266 RepID=UPI00280FA636|nr:DUF1641 domain-containing protein [Pelagicoccus sp. SDUM812002]MDQ8186803.1 DUF1641 domain-containing protein [Pelagicoccus sp. SDUM812002]